jgi:hypothetical protein
MCKRSQPHSKGREHAHRRGHAPTPAHPETSTHTQTDIHTLSQARTHARTHARQGHTHRQTDRPTNAHAQTDRQKRRHVDTRARTHTFVAVGVGGSRFCDSIGRQHRRAFRFRPVGPLGIPACCVIKKRGTRLPKRSLPIAAAPSCVSPCETITRLSRPHTGL